MGGSTGTAGTSAASGSGGVSSVLGGVPLAGTTSNTAGTTAPRTGGASSGGTTSLGSSSTASLLPITGLAVFTKSRSYAAEGALVLSMRIDNKASQAVDLSAVTLRYWYQEEELGSSLVLDAGYVSIGLSGKGTVGGATVVPVSPASSGADHYIELSFTGTLAPYGDKNLNDQFTLMLTLHNPGYAGRVDVINDYSDNGGALGTNDKITLHSGGALVWGTPPGSPDHPDGGVDARPDVGVDAWPDVGAAPDGSQISTVTFSAGVAEGAMSGYGWVAMGDKDIVSSPTCGPSNTPITARAPCLASSTNWDSANALCISATIPALPVAPFTSDYDLNWGIQLGVNVSEPVGPIGRNYSTLTFNLTGTPQTTCWAVVHRAGDAPGTAYCAPVTSGTAVSITSFNTSCWNGTGPNLTAADTPKIDKIGLQVTSTSSEINVNNLCITSIVFGN